MRFFFACHVTNNLSVYHKASKFLYVVTRGVQIMVRYYQRISVTFVLIFKFNSNKVSAKCVYACFHELQTGKDLLKS